MIAPEYVAKMSTVFDQFLRGGALFGKCVDRRVSLWVLSPRWGKIMRFSPFQRLVPCVDECSNERDATNWVIRKRFGSSRRALDPGGLNRKNPLSTPQKGRSNDRIAGG